MAITINRAPARITPVGRPVLYEVETNRFVTAAGTRHEGNTAAIATLPTAGQTLVVSWGDVSITFTFATVPNDSGRQLPTSTSNAAWAAALLENFEVYRDFTVAAISGNKVQFTARATGNEFNVTLGGTYTISYSTVVSGTDSGTQSNFSIAADLYRLNPAGSPLYLKVAEVEATPDEVNQAAAFDFSELLEPYLEPYRPTWELALPVQSEGHLLSYYPIFSEKSGLPPVFGKVKQGDLAFALYGRLPEDNPLFQCGGPYIEDNFLTGPLSFAPTSPRLLSESQQDFAYFLVHDGSTSFELWAQITWSTGVSNNFRLLTQATSSPAVWCIPIGYNQFDWAPGAPAPGATPTVWQLGIVLGSGTVVTLPRCELAPVCKSWERYFVFRNQLGGYESMRTKGALTNLLNISQPTNERSYVADTCEPFAQFFQDPATGQYGARINTGYQRKEWIRYWIDAFLQSPDRYLVDEAREEFIPIVVEPSSLEFERDGQGVHSFAFTFRYAYDTAAKRGFASEEVNVVAGIAIDGTNQRTTGVNVKTTGTAFGIVDIANNGGVIHEHEFRVKGVTVFKISGAGNSAPGAWTFSNWHANILAAGTQANYQALFTGQMNATTGYTFADNVAGMHALLVRDGIVKCAHYNPAVADRGYAREILATAQYLGVTSTTPTTGTVSNQLYAPFKFTITGAVSVTFQRFDGRHAIEWGDGTAALHSGTGSLSKTYSGAGPRTGAYWGDIRLTYAQMTNVSSWTGPLDFSPFQVVDAYLNFGSNSGLTTFSRPAYGTINQLLLTSSSNLGTGTALDLSNLKFTLGATNNNITLTSTKFTSFVPPNSGTIRTWVASGVPLTSVRFNTLQLHASATITLTNASSMTTSSVDQMYADLNAAASAGSSGTISSTGSTPDPTGGLSNANVVALVTKGYAVTI